MMNVLRSLVYFSPLAIISAIAGFFVSGYAGASWLSASLVVAACLVVWGTWSFSDDADVIAEDSREDGDMAMADRISEDKRRNESINTWIVAALITAVLVNEFII